MPIPLMNNKISIEEYYAYTGEERVELIDGFLYDMASPSRIHQAILGELYSTIRDRIREKGGDCLVYPAPFGVQLKDDEDTIVEPDISVICDRDKLTDRGCVGAPDWIIEIASPTSIAHDYIKKLKLYSAAEVREYWIINPSDKSITVYRLSESSVADSYEFTDKVPVYIYKDFTIDFNMVQKMIEREGLN